MSKTKLPPLLTTRLSEARAALLADEKWYLLPGYRYRVYCALEPEPDSEPTGPEAHWSDTRRRARLGIIILRKVLPVWEQSWPHFTPQDEIDWPDFDWPHKLLSVAQQILEGEIASEQIHDILQHNFQYNWTMLDELFSINQSDEFQRCVCVAATAYATLCLCSNDDGFSMIFNSSAHDWREVHIDWDSCDPAQWASMAYAGMWGEKFERDKSREFWTWWIDEAVPQAWCTVRKP